MQFRQLNRSFVIKGHMRAKKVVVSNKEDSKGNSAIDNIEAVRGINVIFISSIKTFNDLFKRSKLF